MCFLCHFENIENKKTFVILVYLIGKISLIDFWASYSLLIPSKLVESDHHC